MRNTKMPHLQVCCLAGRRLRSLDCEGCFDFGSRAYGDLASVGFDRSFYNGEAEASSFDLGLGVVLFDSEEAFEDEG